MAGLPPCTDDPFLLNYQASDLRVASEFLTTWFPFLSRDLCHHCTKILSDRIRSLDPPGIEEADGDMEEAQSPSTPTPDKMEHDLNVNNDDNCDTNSLGSWKDGDVADRSNLGNSTERANGQSESVLDALPSNWASESPAIETPNQRMSWADMAQEDELEEEEQHETNTPLVIGNFPTGVVDGVLKVRQKPELPREQREYLRFQMVKRKRDFECLERVKGKQVNILHGLELHTGIFSAVEQKKIVDYVYDLQERGKKGELKERTYTAPRKWMPGKGRVTIQFGCCYNYAEDKEGNPPGILQNKLVEPIPPLFKVIIKRLVRWHVLPQTCVPDSCIVNIYDQGDCIPPHIDNHDFVRPFCTVSFLSECNILFGRKLEVIGPGHFSGSYPIPLPVGSVLVLNGNGADVAKHCVPAVPTKRISITFRKMDESKRPIGFVPEPDLRGIEPLSYEVERPVSSNSQQRTNIQGIQPLSNEVERPVSSNSQQRTNIQGIQPLSNEVERPVSSNSRHLMNRKGQGIQSLSYEVERPVSSNSHHRMNRRGQGIRPLSYDVERPVSSNSQHRMSREGIIEETRGEGGYGYTENQWGSRSKSQSRRGIVDRGQFKVTLGN